MSRDIQVPSAVTPEIFGEWRAPRRGNANPQKLNNALWQWLPREVGEHLRRHLSETLAKLEPVPVECVDIPR